MQEQINAIVLWVRRQLTEKFNSKNPQFPYYLTIAISFIIFVAALNAFVELTEELAENELKPYDQLIAEFLLTFRSESLTTFFLYVTRLGNRSSFIIISVAVALFFFIKNKSWKFSFQVVSVLVLASLTNIVLKRMIGRARPSLEHLVSVSSLSYPSGHAMSSMAFYGFLIYLCLRYKMRKWLKVLLSLFLVFIILAIGLSRIYLGVHYPTDVAAGFIGGLIWVTFCAIVFSLFDLIRHRKEAKKSES